MRSGRRGLRVVGAVMSALLLSSLVAGSFAPAAAVIASTPPADDTSVPASSAPAETVPPATTQPPAATDPPATSAAPATTEPEITQTSATSQPPATTQATTTTEAPPESSLEADCQPLVDGDGPVVLADGCAQPSLPAVVANPSLPARACGVTVMLVVDASASIDASAARDTLGAVVDAFVDTGSTVGLVELSTKATVRIDPTVLDGSTRASFDSYRSGLSTGSSTDLAAGLAAAAAASPNLVVVVTDGVANASSAGPGEAVAAAVEQANRLKAASTRVVAVGVGTVDETVLAAISGPRAGNDLATADHSVGGGAAVAASLSNAVTVSCPDDRADVRTDDGGELRSSAAVAAAAVTDFCATAPIAIPEFGLASPYPSAITVSGAATTLGVTVQLAGITHPRPTDLDIVLVGPTGANIVLMSDAGSFQPVSGVDLTFADTAAGPIPDVGPMRSGSYRPTNYGAGDGWPSPAPTPSNATSLSTFTGLDPNGVWSLYVVDDQTLNDPGSIAGGWCLTITEGTLTDVVSSRNPSQLGEAVTFTATVTDGGDPVNAGLVTFRDGPAVLANVPVDAAGRASYTSAALTLGTHPITASYGGAAGLPPSSDSVVQTVTSVATGDVCATTPIVIPEIGQASPYPSTIPVSGAGTRTQSLTVQLAGVTHGRPADLAVMLVGPTGASLELMEVVGGTDPASGVDLTFSDSAPGVIPRGGPLASGTYLPSADGRYGDWPSPAPPIGNRFSLSAYSGLDPNGVWSLFVYDRNSLDDGGGSIAGGWCLTMTDETVTTVVSSVNPSRPGEPVTFTATVTDGNNPARGTVTFSEGTTILAADVPLDAAGRASFTAGPGGLSVGTHPITASYSGGGRLGASSGSIVQSVADTSLGTFCNATPLATPDPGQADPYPSTIAVTGAGAVSRSVEVTLAGITHGRPLDLDVLLVGPTGASIVVMSDTGGLVGATGVDVTFTDDATGFIPRGGPLQPGRYWPTGSGSDGSWPAPAPPPPPSLPSPFDQLARTFSGLDPNGVWSLYVVDDSDGAAPNTGSIAGGWCLTIADATVTDVVSSPNPSQPGEAVTFTATVTESGDPVTAGTVTFRENTTVLAADVPLDAAGQASFTSAGDAFAAGTHVVTASYSGAPGLGPSSDSVGQAVIDPALGTVCNSNPIAVPSSGQADPYPSAITIGGASAVAQSVTVQLFSITHPRPDELDVLLVGPTGAYVVVMSDAGGLGDVTGVDLTITDDAPGPIPSVGPLQSGSYRPTNNPFFEEWPAPAPTVQFAIPAMSTFSGLDPNGVWSLYVVDDTTFWDPGSIAGGWCLTITPATVTEVASSSNPSQLGEPVTFTATVTERTDPVTVGTVTFREGPTVLAADVPLDGAGQASFMSAAGTFTVGPHVVTATYSGAPGFGPSNDSITQAVAATELGTFCSASPIAVPRSGPADPYPSAITVSGAVPVARSVTVALGGITHPAPDDLDVLLVGPTGANVILMSDAGGFDDVAGVNLTFDHNVGPIPAQGPLESGRYGPSNYESFGSDSWPAPAPPPDVFAPLSDFGGLDPNGVWSLYVLDDSPLGTGALGTGTIAGGWCVTINAPTVTEIESSPNPSRLGEAVTFTATVTDDGAAVTAGTVTFSEGTTRLAADVPLDAAGQATFTSAGFGPGPHVINARYSGAPGFGPSSDGVLQTVIATAAGDFCATAPIAVPAVGQATPYPSTITVSGAGRRTYSLSVQLAGIIHTNPWDLDIMLVGPTGVSIELMSDVGGGAQANGVDLTFADGASGPIPVGGPLQSGSYRPTRREEGFDWPPPAPPFATSISLSGFSGLDPNGVWSLYVVDDDAAGGGGSIDGGWCLTITDATVTELASSANPSRPGEAVTLTATVTDRDDDPVTVGTVTFSEGATILAADVPLDGAGQASFTSAAFTPGAHQVTASYSGGAGLPPSSDSIRQLVANPAQGLFCSTTPSAVPELGQADPYPSTVSVSGAPPVARSITVELAGITHRAPTDLDILLVGPTGANTVLMSDIGGDADLNGVDLTFAEGGRDIPEVGPLVSGRYRPTNIGAGDSWPAPAPEPAPGFPTLQRFGGLDPNGVWSLYIVDDTALDAGSIGGWCVRITPATVTELVSSVNPSQPGEAVTFTATVTNDGDPVTEGTVTFDEGATILAAEVALDTAGQASFTSAAFTPGTHVVTATYSGAPGLGPSIDSVGQSVSDPALGTFCNATLISTRNAGPADPYPSTITVRGADAVASAVTVQLATVIHEAPIDLDIVLVGPTGASLVLMSDTGGTTVAAGVDLTFADSATGPIPVAGPLATGSYRPTDIGAGDSWPAPAPAVSNATTLSTFSGLDPNGVWSLYVLDDSPGNLGVIGGWCLTTRSPTVTEVGSSPNPSQSGEPVTFTATVTDNDDPATVGTVTFTEGTTILAADVPLDGAGQASFTSAADAFTLGAHEVTASYSGATGLRPSSDSIVQSVNDPAQDMVCNYTPITVPATGTRGSADPYPSTITLSRGPVVTQAVTVQLAGITHERPDDLDVLLVGPTGASIVLMSDIGGFQQVTDVDLTFTDRAIGPIDVFSFLRSGSFRATNIGADDVWPAPAPTASAATMLATFDGLEPSGVWSLYVLDDSNSGAGSIDGGWCVTVTSQPGEPTTTTTTQPPTTTTQPPTTTTTTTTEPPTTTTTQPPTTTTTTTTEPPTTTTTEPPTTTTTEPPTTTTTVPPTTTTTQPPTTTTTTVPPTTTTTQPPTTTTTTVPPTTTTTQPPTTTTTTVPPTTTTTEPPTTTTTEPPTTTTTEPPTTTTTEPPTTTTTTTEPPATTTTTEPPTTTTTEPPTTTTTEPPTTTTTTTEPPTTTPTTEPPTTTPAAMAGGPYRIAEGDDLTMDASASRAGSGATFSWDLDDDGAFDDATGATPTLTWAELMVLGIDGDGSYPVSLQITDGPTTVGDDTTLMVTETASTVSIDGPTSAVAGQPLTIKVGAVDPSPGDLVGTFTYTVDWGDGATPLTVDGPADPPVTHTYATAGRFTVTASFTAPDGVTSDPATFLVTISDRAATSSRPTGSTGSSATLPRTGGDTDVILLFALAVLAAGALTVIASSHIRVRPGRR